MGRQVGDALPRLLGHSLIARRAEHTLERTALRRGFHEDVGTPQVLADDLPRRTRPDRRRAISRADRGSQCSSRLFRSALAGHGMRPSAGRTGSCSRNAVAEAFLVTRKTEIGATAFDTCDDARRDACSPTSTTTTTTVYIRQCPLR